MKLLFDNLSMGISKMTTRTYSSSFSLGIYFLNRRLRNAIYAIYGFVRVADEIVDSFEGYDKKHLLEKFKIETYDAIHARISTNPILNSFQQVVHQYQIRVERAIAAQYIFPSNVVTGSLQRIKYGAAVILSFF